MAQPSFNMATGEKSSDFEERVKLWVANGKHPILLDTRPREDLLRELMNWVNRRHAYLDSATAEREEWLALCCNYVDNTRFFMDKVSKNTGAIAMEYLVAGHKFKDEIRALVQALAERYESQSSPYVECGMVAEADFLCEFLRLNHGIRWGLPNKTPEFRVVGALMALGQPGISVDTIQALKRPPDIERMEQLLKTVLEEAKDLFQRTSVERD